MKNIVLVAGNKKFAHDIGTILDPLGYLVIDSTDPDQLSQMASKKDVRAIVYDEDSFKRSKKLHLDIMRILKTSKKEFIFLSSSQSFTSIYNAKNLGAYDYISKPYNCREFIAKFSAMISRKTKVVCLGGGTGLFHVLLGIKKYPNVLVTSIVSMTDDGGSSGRLRASFGILPPGDIRRSLVALSNAPEIMNKVMQFRFQKDEHLKGHSFGNLFLAALSEIEGSLPKAVRSISDLLHVQGIVLPITQDDSILAACFEDGTVVKGESKIDLCEGRNPELNIKEIWHEPEVKCTMDAFSAIINADVLIIGPGDLFTSIVTNLLVKGIREAISKTKAKKIYICNLMTKPGETANYSAYGHVKEIIRYMHGDCLDYIVVSNTELSKEAIKAYSKKKQSPVSLNDIGKIKNISDAKIIFADIGHETELVRHDSAKIRIELAKILKRSHRER